MGCHQYYFRLAFAAKVNKVEPAIAFAIIKDLMEGSFSADGVAKRIVAITDAAKGTLRKLAEQKGYRTFSVPDNVGGRYSVSWMQQLGPESEGKNGEGLWISPEYYTEMAHANGQMIQMGKRNLIETFLIAENPAPKEPLKK